MTALDALLAFAAAALASVGIVPAAARIAGRLGAVDAPDGRRKSQPAEVPLGGGFAVAVAAGVGLVVALAVGDQGAAFAADASWHLALPSAGALLLLGLLDDTIGLTGIYKLMGQVFAASLLVAAGFQFESISLAGWSLPLGDFGIPFSMFFCLGAINAFNLIDGADALAASIGAVVLTTLGVIASAQGATAAGLANFAVAGALVGFLKYNAPPAQVYLGDTGSMLIGWLVAATAIHSSIKEQAAVALVVPVAICAIPILDALAALIRRMTTGQSVFTADRGHFHHALLLRGWTVGQTAAVAAGLTAITCAGAMASYFTDQEVFAVAAGSGVIVALVSARVFGHAELSLLTTQIGSLTRVFFRRMRPTYSDALKPTDHSIQLQGRRPWGVLWEALREAAATHRLVGLRLNLNIPHLHESFYAQWRASDDEARAAAGWKIALPIAYAGRAVGRLLIEGRPGGKSLAEMQEFLDFLDPLEAEVARIVEEADELSGFRVGRESIATPPAISVSEPLVGATEGN